MRHTRRAPTIVAALSVLYLAASWLDWVEWRGETGIDTSWFYALSKLRAEDLYLGKDIFFTYGPLAQWFGLLAREGQEPALLSFICFGAYFIALFLMLRDILAARRSDGFTAANVLVAIGFFVSLVPLAKNHASLDRPSNFIVAIAFLWAFATLSGGDGSIVPRAARHRLLASAMLTAVLLTLKMTAAIPALAVFLVLCVVLRRRVPKWFPFAVAGGTLLLCHAIFFSLTDSWAFGRYLLRSLAQLSMYSETMIDDSGGSEWKYALAFAACVGFVAANLWLARLRTHSRDVRIGWASSAAIYAFVAFKHGLVRADVHTLTLYTTLLPVSVLVFAFVCFEERRHKALALAFTGCMAALFSVAYGVNLGLLVPPPSEAWRGSAQSWLSFPSRLARVVTPPFGYQGELEAVTTLRGSHPRLFEALDRLCREPEPRTVTFYPWNVIYGAGLVGCRWQPMPSLQLYVEGPHSPNHLADAAVLSSPDAPDLVVIGPQTIDRRNGVSEFTNWLEPLPTGRRGE